MERIQYDLSELHAVQMDLLKRLIEICSRHGLSFFLAFGSLLGAVREHRILEWDDSIDVVMPYQDYSRILEVSQEEWGEGYFMQTYKTDPEYPKYYAKLRDSNTTMILFDYADIDMNHGICINIMPLISLAPEGGLRDKQIKTIKRYKVFTEGKPIDSDNPFSRFLSTCSLRFTPRKNRLAKRDKLLKEIVRYEDAGSDACIALSGNRSIHLPLKKEWFSSAILCEFEDIQAPIPKGWHEWLALRYGDYLKVPIADLQGEKTLNLVTLNTQKPYYYYKGKTYCVKRSDS